MSKKIIGIVTVLVAVIAFFAFEETPAQEQKEPWSQEQLLEPAELAANLNDPTTEDPVILSLGAGGIIMNSTEAGETGKAEGLQSFEAALDTLSRDAEVVIYCGCCPFDICPNVRPAFSLLNQKNFTNHKLLNLRENIKVDWLDKGYPVNK